MKVLAIDDQPEALKQIEKAIQSAKDPSGAAYEVVALADHIEALKRLDEEIFDVVITDMVMGADEDEGLAILRQLTGKSPITIVLTAYPSIPNCVAAMRAGAWDYLEKVPANGGDPYDNLLASLAAAYEFRREHPDAGKSDPEAKWVHAHIAELMRDYGGKVIAVLDGKVVDSDTSYGALQDRLCIRYPLASPLTISIPDTTVGTI